MTSSLFFIAGVFASLFQAVYEEEQRGYYILSSFWAELDKDQVLGEPVAVRTYDMHTCTLEDVQVMFKSISDGVGFGRDISERRCLLGGVCGGSGSGDGSGDTCSSPSMCSS